MAQKAAVQRHAGNPLLDTILIEHKSQIIELYHIKTTENSGEPDLSIIKALNTVVQRHAEKPLTILSGSTGPRSIPG
jgi:hypothetical protein